MSSFSSVRSVERALAILALMNRRPISRVKELADEVSLAPATVVRALETLVELGYVRKQARRTGYTLTEKVRELSAGYHGLPTFVDRAKPVLVDLTRQMLWPAALSTLDGTSMVVRLSTIPDSPLAHTHSTLQKRLDLLTRAHGRAYLAFCSPAERRRLFSDLHQAQITRLTPEEIEDEMAGILHRIRQLGYAERDHEIDPQTTTIAMPVRYHGNVAAVIGMTYFRGAFPKVSMLLQGLSRAVGAIEALMPDEPQDAEPCASTADP